MLTSREKLTMALKQWSARNDLIQNLNSAEEEDKEKRPYKFVLSFWLGSNINIFNFNFLDQESIRLIYIIYYCILIFDKKMSVLSPTSEAYIILNQCLEDLMAFYNQDYALSPQMLAARFKSIIEEMSHDFRITCHALDSKKIFSRLKSIIKKPNNDFLIVYQVQKLCLDELKRTFIENLESIKRPLRNSIEKSNRISSWDLLRLRKDSLSTSISTVITRADAIHPFYLSNTTSGCYHSQKIYVPTHDGMILDALLVMNSRARSDTIVLVLIGPFQSEESYLNESVIAFQKLFESDILFINHRNKSIRSDRFAKHIRELAKDVVTFADYFNHQKKDIVLYGMCGGAAHMILAANILQRKNIAFKLIVDRFAYEYLSFFDFKTSVRQYLNITPRVHQTFPPLFKTILTIISFLLIPALFISFTILAKFLLKLSHMNINFAKEMRALPENDVLVLQVKSKSIKNIEPIYTDLSIHPKNNLRYSVKDRRHKNKLILKILIYDCRRIARLYRNSIFIQHTFSKIAECFYQYLQLIDNEKLTLNGTEEKKVTDLHSHKLYVLKTRHGLPMTTFLRGFFLTPRKTHSKTVSAFTAYSAEDIFNVMIILHPEQLSTCYTEAAFTLSRFLKNIKKHEEFICHIDNRLRITGLDNLDHHLEALLQTELFKLLSKTHRDYIRPLK